MDLRYRQSDALGESGMGRAVRPWLEAHQPGDEREPIEWSREEDVLLSREHESPLPNDRWLDERFPLALLLLAGAIFGFVMVVVAF